MCVKGRPVPIMYYRNILLLLSFGLASAAPQDRVDDLTSSAETNFPTVKDSSIETQTFISPEDRRKTIREINGDPTSIPLPANHRADDYEDHRTTVADTVTYTDNDDISRTTLQDFENFKSSLKHDFDNNKNVQPDTGFDKNTAIEATSIEAKTTEANTDVEKSTVKVDLETLKSTIRPRFSLQKSTAKPRLYSKLSYFQKKDIDGVTTNQLESRNSKRMYRSKCRCEKISNCPKLQISVPRCPEEQFMCCF